MQYSKGSSIELAKLKHELLGSLGVIRALAMSMIVEGEDELKVQKYLNLIDSLVDRNIHNLIDFNKKISSNLRDVEQTTISN